MKVSWNWLREFVRLEGVAAKDVAERLSAAGVAVDGLAAVGAGLSGAIIGEVRGKRPHPKADKLTLVDVFDGQTVTQVVCGAPNVPEPGEPGSSPRVVWARPGARLPSGLELGVREVRGIPSPGMLCAEDELGLGSDHAGIVILRKEDGLEIGSDFAQGVELPDFIFDLDITPNRPDLLGHVGVAREVAALYAKEGARLTLPSFDFAPYLDEKPASSRASIVIADSVGCPRYLGHVLCGLRVAPSPIRLRLLLQRLGARPLSNLVDATNLALFAFGQPLHAFDLQHLAGAKILVRRAHAGESIKTLDGTTRMLHLEDLVIADAERPIAIAGVMGGHDSEVRAQTQDVLLESAYFDPLSVRRTARRLKLHSEASHRFERGVDPNAGLEQAARYCLGLMLQNGGGRLLRGGIDVYPHPIHPKVIDLRPARTSRMLGLDISAAVQAERLTALGLSVDVLHGETEKLSVTVPAYRPDLLREIDLIEEVGRLIGYQAVVARVPALHMAPPPPLTPDAVRRQTSERTRDLCAALGLDEVQLFSMTGPDKLQKVAGALAEKRPPLLLENPLREELSALRTQLLPGLLDALRQNLNHGLTEVRLFEVGEAFFAQAGSVLPIERTRVAGVMCGHRPYLLKPTDKDALDFADLRGIVEELLSGLGYALHFAPNSEGKAGASPLDVYIRASSCDETPWLHPGVSALILSTDTQQIVGDFGEVHPDLCQRLEIEERVFAFEIEISSHTRPQGSHYQPPSRFPAVSRDLSFFIDRDTPAAQVCATLEAARQPLLRDIAVLEDYREAGKVPDGKKGLLFGLIYRSDERTLTDEEVQKAHDHVLGHLQKSLTVQLR